MYSIQECRWRGVSARMIVGKDSRYTSAFRPVTVQIEVAGVLLVEKWVGKVFDVKRVSDRLMMIKMIFGEVVVAMLLVYAPQSGLTIAEKVLFYNNLQDIVLQKLMIRRYF